MSLNLIERARVFALDAHKGLTRLNRANEPYSFHLEEVAGLVEQASGGEVEIASAWLHDTVEDTTTTIKVIGRLFGAEVATIVDGLTDPPNFAIMPTLERKKFQAFRVSSKDNSVKLVKIADQISNLRSVAIDPPVKWTEEKCKCYIAGAHLIAIECGGVSPLLDSLFHQAYERARAVHP